MSDIFISYARADKDRAELLAKAFSRQGWSVWWDREIPPGKSFDETIENALNSARCVIVLWSKDSVSSRWVKTEAAEGAVRGILIPALIDKVQIPLEFKRIEAADLSDWQGDSPHFEFDQLLNIVASILGGSAPTQIKQMLTNTKLRSRRWWKTIPGLVSATVGIIIAMTGLIVALYQAGVFDTERNRAPQAQNNTTTSPATTKSLAVPGRASGTAMPSATDQAIQMPDGRSVTMNFMDNKFQYTILSAQRELLPPDKYLLHFRIRVWTDFAGMGFVSDSFRLYSGDLHLKPTIAFSEWVRRDETKDRDVEFEVDGSIKEAILVITVFGVDFPGNTRQLRLAFP
jgi:TIR domain